ncbi:MAG: helix-turn-helix domain-containing protein [Chloroflexota bacterium]
MLATYYIPSPPLDAYVDHLYYLDHLLPYAREKILPDAGLDLKINLGGVIRAYKPGQPEPFMIGSDSWGVGLWSAYHIIDWPQDIQFFGVNFKPGGAYPFLRIPLSELHDGVVSLDAIWGYVAAEIRERLCAVPTLAERFALLERLLLARLSETLAQDRHDFRAVHYALAQMGLRHGALSIKELSDKIGISQNHLTNQFKRLVGGTPKEIARLYRFQHILQNIDPLHPVEWTEVAHQALYYDQSHFNKDFMAFTGHTPGDYLRLRQQVYAESPQHAWYFRALPTD